jgi:hypothetical protein
MFVKSVCERLRAACDEFFASHSTFFKEMEVAFASNGEDEKALVEKASRLRVDRLDVDYGHAHRLQKKEWKNVGAVPKTLATSVTDFFSACQPFIRTAMPPTPVPAMRSMPTWPRNVT